MADRGQIWTPPVSDGELAVSFKCEDGKLLKRTTQVDRDQQLQGNVVQRRDAPRQNFLGGWKVASIPALDVPRVKAKYPELFDRQADAELRRTALVRFSNDRDFQHLIIKRA